MIMTLEAATGSKKCGKKDPPAVLISHPTGNQNVRNAVRSLSENGMLQEFWTTLAWDPHSSWNRLVPEGLRTQLARRAFPEAPRERVKRVPWREVIRLGARPRVLKSLLCSGERPFSIIGMYRHFDSKVARRLKVTHANGVYCYEGGALETFREARRRAIKTIYELPSSYWYWTRKLLSEEAERNPEFANLLPILADSAGHLEWKDEELRLADFVFAPSEHVRRTLEGVVPDEKVRVISYGAPSIRTRKPAPRNPNRALSILFVGALIQRKGISYVLEAVNLLGSRAELTLVGTRFRANRRVDEACQHWRWFETLPHGRVLDVMTESDVLVLPSLCEAFGLVVTEALACGLPVIVTPNVGASDLIRDGWEGYVVPVRSAEAIASRLDTLDRDRELLAEMSIRAQATATERSWASYRTKWASALRESL